MIFVTWNNSRWIIYTWSFLSFFDVMSTVQNLDDLTRKLFVYLLFDVMIVAYFSRQIMRICFVLKFRLFREIFCPSISSLLEGLLLLRQSSRFCCLVTQLGQLHHPNEWSIEFKPITHISRIIQSFQIISWNILKSIIKKGFFQSYLFQNDGEFQLFLSLAFSLQYQILP